MLVRVESNQYLETMNIRQIIRRLALFVKPYKSLVVFPIFHTLVGTLAAQVNPIVLRYNVDTIQQLLNEGGAAAESASLLLFITAVLFGKELVNISVRYGQIMLGERLRMFFFAAKPRSINRKILFTLFPWHSYGELNQSGKNPASREESVSSRSNRTASQLIPHGRAAAFQRSATAHRHRTAFPQKSSDHFPRRTDSQPRCDCDRANQKQS